MRVGIDIGTTTICVLAIDDGGNILSTKTVPNDVFLESKPYESIQNPERISEIVFSLLGELEDIQSIGITGQMHGVLYIDENGNAVSNLATWQDSRGDLAYQNGTYASRLSDLTDAFCASGFGLTTHFYNIKNNLVPDNAKKICTIHDYIGMKLCGNKAPVMHTSDAASFGVFDIENGEFYSDRLEKAGIDTAILPEVVDDYRVIGYYKNAPVTVAIGDNQASFIGAGGDKDSILLNFGTGSQVSIICDFVPENLPKIECRPLGNKKYILVGSALCGGRAYSILEKFCRTTVEKLTGKPSENLYAIMDELAENSLDNEDLVVRTTFCGTRQNPELRGEISNISPENFTIENIIVGTLFGMANEIYDLYFEMSKFISEKPKRIICSGNGIRKNRPLQKIIKNQYNLPLEFSKVEEEAAYGAAMLFSLQ
ncbi:MAG TPA: hypothetical protein GXZ23_00420 [Clostridiales bacterium]|nr:hypothetical protein [Clostridiales bacterium]